MSDVTHTNQQFDNSSTFHILSEELINKNHNSDHKFECINPDIIHQIENQLYNLRDWPKNHEDVFQISEIVLQLFNTLKHDYYDNYMELRTELMKGNQFSNDTKNLSLSNINTKSNSLLSIVDIKMEINESDSLNRLLSSIDLNKNQTKKVVIFKETSINTEINIVENQSTQTIPDVTDRNIDSTSKFQALQQQSIDIQNLILKLAGKNQLVEEKFNQYLTARRDNQKDVEVNTEDNWQEKWDLMLRAVGRLMDVETRLKQREIDVERLTTENIELTNQVANLTDRLKETSAELKEVSTEMRDVRETNEFLDAEHQGMIAQIDRIQADWKAWMTLHNDSMNKFKTEFREKNTTLSLKNQSMEFQLSQEKIYNSGDKVEVEWLQKRLEKVEKDVEQYPVYGTDWQQEMMELKKKVTLLEDKRIAHAQEKQKWITQRERLVEEVKKGNSYLTQKNSTLKKFVTELQSNNQMLREKYDRYLNCWQELRRINLSAENRPAEKYIEAFREILSKFDV